MRDKGVLASRKEANQVFYRIKDPKVFDLLALVKELFCDPPAEG
jgi:ArsR family transcriptional regulator